MIPFKNRFHGHGGLRYVYSKGQIRRSRFATLKYITTAKRNKPRIAVVVSKKVIKSAVKRNRIRRRIYEYIRVQIEDIIPTSDIVVIVTSSEFSTMTASELKTQLDQLFKDSNLYKTPQN